MVVGAFAFLHLPKGVSMFWLFLIAVAAELALIKLGALSVWVGVLSLTLKAVLSPPSLPPYSSARHSHGVTTEATGQAGNASSTFQGVNHAISARC